MLKKIPLIPLFFIFLLLFSLPITDFVKSTTAIYRCEWDDFGLGATWGINAGDGISFYALSGNAEVDDTYGVPYNNDMRLQYYSAIGDTSKDKVRINFTEIGTNYVYDIVLYFCILGNCLVGEDYTNISFYKSSGTEVLRIVFHSTSGLYDSIGYRTSTGTVITLKNTTMFNYNMTLRITYVNTNTLRYRLSYYTNSTSIYDGNGVSMETINWTRFNYIIAGNYGNFQPLDRHSLYLGDIHTYMSSDLVVAEEPCVDYTGYYDVNHIRDYQALSVLPTACKYLEFQNWYEMTANLYGFEFLVDSQQMEKDSVLNHYGLFINGFFAGNPICKYQYDGDRTSLQWDFTDTPIFIDNERIIFEMYHDNVPGGSYAWYLPIEYNTVFPPVPSEIYYYSDTSHIDGLLSYSDMSLREHKLSWRLFFNLGVNTTVDCDYTNTILLKDSSGNSLANHPVYNIPFSYPYRTIFFAVFVNDTSEYSLNVYRQGVPVGFTQYYPKDMTLCDGVYGFTPLNSGNYTVSLYDGDGYFLNQTFNITHIDTSFAIWTYPNPSLQQSSVTIGVYAENPNKYANYSIGLSYNITLLNTFDTSKLSQVFYIPGFIGNYYYLETEMLFQYIRLFATNGTVYIPITPVYNHKILSADTTNTIDTTLGDDDSGITNLEFFVWGKYRSSPIGTAKIYKNSEYVGTTQYGTFSFSQIIQTSGTYTYSLREYVGNSYTVLASVTVTITDVTTSQDSDIQLDFGVFINTILGLLLVLLLTLSPAIVTIWLAQKSNITNINIPGLLYVAMFLLGIIVSCIIGWFPLWVLLFVIIGLALTVFILWLRSKSESD